MTNKTYRQSCIYDSTASIFGIQLRHFSNQSGRYNQLKFTHTHKNRLNTHGTFYLEIRKYHTSIYSARLNFIKAWNLVVQTRISCIVDNYAKPIHLTSQQISLGTYNDTSQTDSKHKNINLAKYRNATYECSEKCVLKS